MSTTRDEITNAIANIVTDPDDGHFFPTVREIVNRVLGRKSPPRALYNSTENTVRSHLLSARRKFEGDYPEYKTVALSEEYWLDGCPVPESIEEARPYLALTRRIYGLHIAHKNGPNHLLAAAIQIQFATGKGRILTNLNVALDAVENGTLSGEELERAIRGSNLHLLSSSLRGLKRALPSPYSNRLKAGAIGVIGS